jgi:hypothetical protein
MTPPKAGSGGGSCFPVIVVVALGEPSLPVTSWADALKAVTKMKTREITNATTRYITILQTTQRWLSRI